MTDEQAAAFAQLRRLASPMRLRVGADAEGFPVVRGKLGDLEWQHAGGTDLAAYTAGNKARLGRLLSLPNIRRHQLGDSECRILFPVAMLPEVAKAIQARRRRGQPSPASLQALERHRHRLTSGGAQSIPSPEAGERGRPPLSDPRPEVRPQGHADVTPSPGPVPSLDALAADPGTTLG